MAADGFSRGMTGVSRPARRRFWQSGALAAWAAALGSLAPTAAPAQGPQRAPTQEHVLILAPQTPVFLTLELDAGSLNVSALREKFADTQFRRLDKDDNGEISAAEFEAWKAAGRPDPFLDPILSRMKADEPTSRDRFRELVQGTLGPPFQVVADRKRLDQTVDLFPMLDLDRDGRLSGDEVRQGLAILRSTDFDDDESLSVAELQPFPRSIVEARRQEAATESPDIPVLSLSTAAERKTAAERIHAVYRDKGAGIPLTRLDPESRRTIRKADKNRDKQLDAEELLAWLETGPSDAVLTVSIDRNRVKVQEASLNPVVAPAASNIPSRPSLVVGGMTVDFVAKNNRVDQQDNVYFYKLDFRRGDTDKNGYLDEAEFAASGMNGLAFATVDADGNKQVTLPEIVEYASVNGQIAQARLVVTVGDEARSLFQILDADLDRRLTMREFTKAPAALEELDRDRNGLAAGELVSRYRLRFQYGTPDRMQRRGMDDAMATGVPIARPQQTSGPTWFRRMDRNQDGDLSWREFLGERTAFDQLDTDKNGMIDLDEAMAADQQLRTPAASPEATATP